MGKFSKKRFLFICPDIKSPVGGIKMIYDTCYEFSTMGLDAYVVHCYPKTKIIWFESKSKVCFNNSLFPVSIKKDSLKYQIIGYLRKMKKYLLGQQDSFRLDYINVNWDTDLLIYPERLFPWAIYNLKHKKTVCFNQNVYKYLHAENFDRKEIKNAQKQAIFHFVGSEDSLNYLTLLLESTKIIRLKYYIDTDLFLPLKKVNKICYMSRKNSKNSKQVLNFLEDYAVLNKWEMVDINRVSQAEAAKQMGESKIFLSFSETEGFGLPPIEALSCGCFVIGYHGEGGREYFDAGNFIEPVEADNILDYVEKVKNWMDKLQNDNLFSPLSILARKFVIDNYSKEVSSTFNRKQIEKFLDSLHEKDHL